MDNNQMERYTFAITGEPEQKKKRGGLNGAIIAGAVALSILSGTVGGFIGSSRNEPELPAYAGSILEGAGVSDVRELAQNLTGDALTPNQLYKKCNPGVVTVNVSYTTRTSNGRQSQASGSGSGFIISSDGVIVTNQHVVGSVSEISVELYDGKTYKAELLGSDAVMDIAVLKISASGLTALELGDSALCEVGDLVAAIGNPLGEFANSLSVGYIGGIDRDVTVDSLTRAMIQTDTALNPGNSGGPLLNELGQVIGVVTAKSIGQDVEGVGFAIPINDVKDIIESLRDKGVVSGRPYIGITGQDAVSEVGSADSYNDFFSRLPGGNWQLPEDWSGTMSSYTVGGVEVVTVESGSPAEKAGLKEGDIITEWKGEKVAGINDLVAKKNECKVGDSVKMTVKRGEETLTLTIVLEETPGR